jgi:hypothetical protein
MAVEVEEATAGQEYWMIFSEEEVEAVVGAQVFLQSLN